MVKSKVDRKKPSRKRYEEEHPTVSFRLDRETYDRLKQHLDGSGCSFADFVKDSIGREESMVEKRVEMLASRKADPSVEERLRFLEGLIAEVMIIAYEPETPWWCPRCGQELADAMIAEKGATSPDIFVYACPKCHFFVVPWGDAPKGIAVDSLRFEAKK
jgi:hypothetical protein